MVCVLIKCTRCKLSLDESNFKINLNGKTLKRCNPCRFYMNERNRKYLCEHGLQKYYCKLCGGAGICEHKKRRSDCKECGGSQICEHNIQKSKCKLCGGSEICEHNIQKYYCKKCKGAGICEHNIKRRYCKKCNDPIEITIYRWIENSRTSDTECDRLDENNLIDKCFCEDLQERTGKSCYYCKRLLQYVEYDESLATIERLNNRIGHIKSNCVIACALCNNKHKNKGVFEYKPDV